jgi:selenophosphate synthase
MGPSKRLKALQQEKSDLVARMEGLLNSADDDHRDLTADEDKDDHELEEFETVLQSDTAPRAGLAQVLIQNCPGIRAMRDSTRGGISSALHELAEASQVGVKLVESAIRCGMKSRRPAKCWGLTHCTWQVKVN